LLGPTPSHRLFALTSGAGLIHSDDESCSWTPAGGALSDVMPYAFAVDPTSEQRVYAIGVLRENFDAGESLYVSSDGGVTFGAPVFTAPPRTALMTVMVVPSRPTTLLASVFSAPENHPSLLRSVDAGEHWEVVADLVDSLGENPFELLAIDPADENIVYVRMLGPADETLAISRDGGLTFARVVSIPGKLNAFLKLASGTLLVGGSAGNDALAYRSSDAGLTFQRWSGAPNIHALAERGGKLYIAANNFADGYAIGESEDDGIYIRPLAGFKDVRGVKSCVAEACASSCAYQAGINLWPDAVCAADSGPAESSGAAGVPSGSDDASSNATSGGAAASGELERRPSGGAASADPPPSKGPSEPEAVVAVGGGCACSLAQPQSRHAWACLAALLPLLRRRAIRRA